MQTNKKRIIIRTLLVLSFAVPFCLALPAWFSDRGFPTTPFYLNAINFSHEIDIFLLLVFGFFALWFLLKDSSKAGILFFVMYVVFCLLDQTRIQPAFFEVTIIIFLYSVFKNEPKQFKWAFLLLMAGTYTWSGLHKCNSLFYEVWAGGLEKRVPFIPNFLRQLFTWAVPFIEASFGISLLFSRIRRLGIIGIAVMHLMILTTLVLGKGGYGVYALNILNPTLLIFICYNFKEDVAVVFSKKRIKLIVVAFYGLILPAFNLVGVYDHYLAFSYFSGKPQYCKIIIIDRSNVEKLPENIKNFVYEAEGKGTISVNYWSSYYLGIAVYPEERVYKYLQNYIESYTGLNTTRLKFYVKDTN